MRKYVDRILIVVAFAAASACLPPPAAAMGLPDAVAISCRKGPDTSPKSRGAGEDLRDKLIKIAPTVMKGAAIMLILTLIIMTLILVPVGWMRRVVARQAEKSGGLALPSSRKHYVKMGSLGVPSEYEWRPPNLVVGGNIFGMQLAQRVDKNKWRLEDGMDIEFVSKEEVDEARARHEQEFRAQQEAGRAMRQFNPEDPGEEGKQV